MFVGVFRHLPSFLWLKLCLCVLCGTLCLSCVVIMGDDQAAETEYSKHKCDPSIGVSDLEVYLAIFPLAPPPLPTHPLPNPTQISLGDVFIKP